MPKSRHRKKKRSPGSRSGRNLREAAMREVASFPLRECLINEGWDEGRMASISIARNRPDGRVAVGAFAVDLGCLGVKSALANDSISTAQYYERFVHGAATKQAPCDPAFAVKLILGAVEYAEELGIGPDPDYYYSREIFGDIDPASCQETIEYGRDGKPFYVSGPYDDVRGIVDHLTRRLGPDGFHYLIMMGGLDE
ncbi:MAG: hypothetical protein L0229_23480 [Blastocatellia bacterium]|nr:hypothetical protein [Blastocatellia bacterium]